VEQSNYHDFPILRMRETPRIDVHLVDSGQHPGGIGELGVPPIAPALANAKLAATGTPVRAWPISLGA
jgi:isoquinoline 1-oxidoreductase beta subunit